MADIEKLRANLEKNGFQTSYFTQEAEAVDYLCGAIQGRTVGFGGSKTLEALGLYERLAENNRVAWHWKSGADAARKEAQEAEIYLCSANGVAETGEIVNIDGTGNRLAATLYGKEKVYFVIGVNKIEPDLESAIARARNIASPLNACRFGLKTPCAVAEDKRCYDCASPQRICKALLIHWQKTNGVKECEVVIIDKNLGY